MPIRFVFTIQALFRLIHFLIQAEMSNFAPERLKRAPACSRRSLSFRCEVQSTLPLVKPKDVHQPLGWQALLTACEVLRTLSLGIWVLGVRWWQSLRVRKSLPTQGDLEGLFKSASPPFQVRFKSVSSPFLKMGLTWESQGSQLGGTWESLRISNRD